MEIITINIKNDSIKKRVNKFLEEFKSEDLEIISKEDLDDLKKIYDTRGEETLSLDEFVDGIKN